MSSATYGPVPKLSTYSGCTEIIPALDDEVADSPFAFSIRHKVPRGRLRDYFLHNTLTGIVLCYMLWSKGGTKYGRNADQQ